MKWNFDFHYIKLIFHNNITCKKTDNIKMHSKNFKRANSTFQSVSEIHQTTINKMHNDNIKQQNLPSSSN